MIKSLTKGATISRSTIWNIAYSIMLGNLAQTIISVTDTAFLGRLGEVELGASGMSGIYYYFFTTLAWGFSIGLQIIVARRLGEGRNNEIGKILLHGIIFILGFSLILFNVIHFLSPHFLKAVITSDKVYEVAIRFLSCRGYGVFFACINFLFRSFYIGLSKTRCISYSTIIMACVNIFLDWALIFGTPFNKAYGVEGAAIASVSAEISASIFFVLYTTFTKPIEGERVFAGFKFDFTIIKNMFKLSIPTMMQKCLSYGIWLYFFFMIESMGERSLAITMVLRNIFMMVSIPAFAFGAATNTITSRLIGQNKDDEVLPSIWKTLSVGVIVTLPLIALICIFPRFWVGLCTESVDIINGAQPIMYLICFTTLSFCSGMGFFEAVSGTGYTNKAFYIELAALVVYILIIWYSIDIAKASLFWVWSSELAYGIVLSLSSLLFLKKYNWRKRNI